MDLETGGSRPHRVVADDFEPCELKMRSLDCAGPGGRLMVTTAVYHHEDRQDRHGGSDNADQDQALVEGAGRGAITLRFHIRDSASLLSGGARDLSPMKL